MIAQLLARITLKERKLLEGIAREMLTRTDKKNIAFLTPTASKSHQTMQGPHLLHKATRPSGWLPVCCKSAFEFNLLSDLPIRITAQARKTRGVPLWLLPPEEILRMRQKRQTAAARQGHAFQEPARGFLNNEEIETGSNGNNHGLQNYQCCSTKEMFKYNQSLWNVTKGLLLSLKLFTINGPCDCNVPIK